MKTIVLTDEQTALLVKWLDEWHHTASMEMKEEELPLVCVVETIMQQLGVEGYEWS